MDDEYRPQIFTGTTQAGWIQSSRLPLTQARVVLALAAAQPAARTPGVPSGTLSLAQHARSPGDHTPPPQAQACLLLQKALPVRELRLCFEDPEWEQLIGQILAKVTEVTAMEVPSHTPIRNGSEMGSKDYWDPSPRVGWGCPRKACLRRGFGLYVGKGSGKHCRAAQHGHRLLRTFRHWAKRRPSRSN